MCCCRFWLYLDLKQRFVMLKGVEGPIWFAVNRFVWRGLENCWIGCEQFVWVLELWLCCNFFDACFFDSIFVYRFAASVWWCFFSPVEIVSSVLISSFSFKGWYKFLKGNKLKDHELAWWVIKWLLKVGTRFSLIWKEKVDLSNFCHWRWRVWAEERKDLEQIF